MALSSLINIKRAFKEISFKCCFKSQNSVNPALVPGDIIPECRYQDRGCPPAGLFLDTEDTEESTILHNFAQYKHISLWGSVV